MYELMVQMYGVAMADRRIERMVFEIKEHWDSREELEAAVAAAKVESSVWPGQSEDEE